MLATLRSASVLRVRALSRPPGRRYHPPMSAFSGPRLVYAMAVLLAIVTPPVAFYGWFELQSRLITDRQALDAGYTNSLKHAEAAAALYSTLLFVGVDARASEQIVIGLGVLNEYAELYVKRGRKDSTLEMMRDLHSN